VAALPADRVDLQLNEETQTLHIACARTEANIKGIDAQEFPLVPEPDTDNRIRVEKDILSQMIQQVAFAAATDDTRPVLTGVSATFSKDKLSMAATDGFRLSVRSANIPGYVEKEQSVIIPSRALVEVSRVLHDAETVHISLPEGRNQIIFDMENIVVVSQLIDGAFPDYTPIIPSRVGTRTVMSTSDFAKACKTAAIFARESSHTARVSIEPEDELNRAHAIIAATSSEMGDNVAQIDAIVDGEGIEIAFNVKYMTDVLNVIDTPQVALETTSAMEPGVIRPVGDNDFLHVIMPMHFGK
jgi:DNA polymerase-3 subunit beta